MLYIEMEVNGHFIKVFVDTGAQMTIMLKETAVNFGLIRWMDKRYRGIARGVGSAEILGKIHNVSRRPDRGTVGACMHACMLVRARVCARPGKGVRAAGPGRDPRQRGGAPPILPPQPPG